jgi:predicted HD phosphohydrolase
MVRWLQARTNPSDDLLAAALLHDVGKGRLHVVDRVAFVLLGRLSGRLRARLGAPEGMRFRQALWRLEHHPRLGRELLADVSRPRVTDLVAAHLASGAGDDEELRWLMAADSAC